MTQCTAVMAGDPWAQRFGIDQRRLAAHINGKTIIKPPMVIPDETFNDDINIDKTAAAADAGRAMLGEFEYLQRKRRWEAEQRLKRELLEQQFSGQLTPAQEARRHAITAGIMTAAEMAQLPDPVPLIEGLLYEDSIAWLAGESGSYKSFIALDIVARYASGEDDYHGIPMAHGKALIVVGEGNAAFKQRTAAWEAYHGREWPDSAVFHNGAIQFGDRDSVAALCAVVKDGEYGLVVLDTQAMMTVGMEENNAGEMGIFVAALHGLRKACGGCILVVHHFGKATGDMRGSGAMYAAATTVLVTGLDGQQVTLSTRHADRGKQKDAQEQEYPPFVMQEVSGSLVVTAPAPLGGEQRYRAPAVEWEWRRWTRPVLAVLRDRDVHGATQSEIRRWIEDDGMGQVNAGMLSREITKLFKEGRLDGGKTSLRLTREGCESLESER